MANNESMNPSESTSDTQSQALEAAPVSVSATAQPKAEKQMDAPGPEVRVPAEERSGQADAPLASRLDQAALKLDKAIEISAAPAAAQSVDVAPANPAAQAAAKEGPSAAPASLENSIEPTAEKKLKLDEEAALALEKRRHYDEEVARWVKNRNSSEPRRENQVESGEPLAPTTLDRRSAIPPEIDAKYQRQGDKYFDKQDLDSSFVDKGTRLETKSSDEAVAQSMVRVAQARGWDEINVKGTEAFRREAWLEAEALGIKVKGYAPNEQDKAAALAKGARDPELNSVAQSQEKSKAIEAAKSPQAEPEKAETQEKKMAQAFRNESKTEVLKKYPQLASSYVAIAAMDQKAEADGLNPAQRAIVAQRVQENTAKSIEKGALPVVTVKHQVEVKKERTVEAERSR